MQEIRQNLMQRLHEPVDLEQEVKLARMAEERSMKEPHPSGLNRKQRRALARTRG